MKKIADRMDMVVPSQINEFFNMLLEDNSAIPLCVGQPNFSTPRHISEAASQSILKGKNFYTDDNGMKEVREEVTTFVKRKYQCDYTSKQVLLTIGASEAIDLAMRVLVDPGDEVIVFDPIYDAYCPCICLNGGIPIHIELKEENQFKVKASDLERKITSKTKAIILNFPNNPTGAIMTREDLIPIAELCIKYDLYVITDEVYSELTYCGFHCTIASLGGMKERTILINSLSKTYAMTGFRLGYICASQKIIDAMRKIHGYVIVSCPSMSQYAAIEALKNGDDDIAYMREDYDKRRKYAYQRVRDMGLDCFEPKGAFYLFPSIKKFNIDSFTFAMRLFKEKKVSVIPGTAFGKSGEYNLRISYTCSFENLVVGLNRLEEFIHSLEAK
mgnify:CR=1 FL=1